MNINTILTVYTDILLISAWSIPIIIAFKSKY